MDFSQLSYFQFENLVKNRIPFLLLALDDINFQDFYTGIYQRHLQDQIVPIQKDQIKTYIQEKQLPPHHSILIVCSNGKVSSQVARELEKNGFLNCFSIQGGFQQLVKEREQNI